MEEYLRPTAILDSDHPDVVAFAREAAGGASDPVEQAVRVYYAVRDGIWYDPYRPFHRPEHYRASLVLRDRRGFCIPKASLLTAAARALGIPARPGFATVRNHLATRQLLEFLGTDLFAYHAFVELYLEGKWVKATPAFNKELCARHGTDPLEFDGRHDSIFQEYGAGHRRFMEYVAFHGTRPDIPVDEIVAAWEERSGRVRVRGWIEAYERRAAAHEGSFDEEEVAAP